MYRHLLHRKIQQWLEAEFSLWLNYSVGHRQGHYRLKAKRKVPWSIQTRQEEEKIDGLDGCIEVLHFFSTENADCLTTKSVKSDPILYTKFN